MMIHTVLVAAIHRSRTRFQISRTRFQFSRTRFRFSRTHCRTHSARLCSPPLPQGEPALQKLGASSSMRLHARRTDALNDCVTHVAAHEEEPLLLLPPTLHALVVRISSTGL